MDRGRAALAGTTPRPEFVDARSRGGPVLLAAGLGALVAVLAALASADPPPPPPGDVALWAADRDASRVFGLDADLRVARRIPVDWPLDVEPAHDGGLWVLRSGSGTADSTQRLDRFDAQGQLVNELFLERAGDLDVLSGGEQALVVELRPGELPRAIRVTTGGSLFPVHERAGMRAVLGERETALIGTSDGVVARVHASTGAVVASATIGGSVADLAAGPAPGQVFVLDDAAPGRVLLLDAALVVRWSVTLPRRSGGLAPVRGSEGVWVVATDEPCVTRFGAGGALELDRCGLPLPGLDRALAWRDGLLVTAVGAILRLDRDGNLLPGQGGFDAVVDLAPRSRRP